MANLNKVMLIGRLTRDPELRYTPGGSAVADASIATNREWTKKDSNEKQKETCFVDLVIWGRRAEVFCQYQKKGDETYVEGRLQLDTWETNDGQKRSKLRVVVDDFQFLGGKREEAPATDQQSGGDQTPAPAPAGEPLSAEQKEQAANLGADFGNDDAIPF